jgi:hypothetical protein
VDVSLWLAHVQAAVGGLSYPNMPAQSLFDKMAKFYQYGFRVLFVFDGPARPHIKRDKHVSGAALQYEHLAKKIIDAFGFEWLRAPGEAEAELAHLNAAGVIDWIVTDDSDTFIFGGLNVLRNHSLKLTGNKTMAARKEKLIASQQSKGKKKGTPDSGDESSPVEEEVEEEDQVTLPKSDDTPCVVFRMSTIKAKTSCRAAITTRPASSAAATSSRPPWLAVASAKRSSRPTSTQT